MVDHGCHRRQQTSVSLGEGQGGLEMKLVGVLIVSEDVTYLGQSRRNDFNRTAECGAEGSSLILQQLYNESDYSDRTRKSIACLGNRSANQALSPLEYARRLKYGLAHRLLQFLGLHRVRRTFEHVDCDLARTCNSSIVGT